MVQCPRTPSGSPTPHPPVVPRNVTVSALSEEPIVPEPVLEASTLSVVEERLVDDTLSLTDDPEPPPEDDDGSVPAEPDDSPSEVASDDSNVGLSAVHDAMSRHPTPTRGTLKKCNSISARSSTEEQGRRA